MAEGLQHQRYGGLMFIGYHSAAGEHGVLAHTINGRAFYRVSLNGEAVGESDLYAAAAELSVPLWLVSGDNMAAPIRLLSVFSYLATTQN
ncbi:D-aminopeptidase [Serratia marcescens]|nr:hypothetical protein SCH909_2432 [Serratia marcescens]CUY28363.1 D-aminopeptidase [Serratia marcescens]CUY36662.1 D-aminopeptidase [Serratia marcescens]CUY42832.1 D-aminopeptidase [Serratia marcescens]CUY52744.1 D-aminopeptidase [Serratia marcescens]